jgi:hypothetical protein
MTVDRIMADQARGGTYREHVVKLQKEFRDLVSDGAPDPATFERLLCRLLQNFEQERLNNEAQIRRLQNEMAYCEATNRACVMFSNVLVNVVASVRHDLKPIETTPVSEKPVPISDTEMLKKICICGCVDDEDTANCNCVCHTKGFCDVPTCIHCQTIKQKQKEEPPQDNGTRKTKAQTVLLPKKRGRKKKVLNN